MSHMVVQGHASEVPSQSLAKSIQEDSTWPWVLGQSPPCWYHVWVVPVPRAGHRLQHILVDHKPVQDGQHAPPGVLDVIKVAPEVADVCQQGVVHLDLGAGRESRASVTLCGPETVQGLGRLSRGHRGWEGGRDQAFSMLRMRKGLGGSVRPLGLPRPPLQACCLLETDPSLSCQRGPSPGYRNPGWGPQSRPPTCPSLSQGESHPPSGFSLQSAHLIPPFPAGPWRGAHEASRRLGPICLALHWSSGPPSPLGTTQDSACLQRCHVST